MAALSQTPGSVIKGADATTRNVVAGGTITAGMPVYKDLTDGNKHKAARANAVATSIVEGIALTGSSNNQPLVIQTLAGGGDINLGATLIVGEVYGVSDAVAGQIVPIADLGSADIVQLLGVAETASNLILGALTAGVAKA